VRYARLEELFKSIAGMAVHSEHSYKHLMATLIQQRDMVLRPPTTQRRPSRSTSIPAAQMLPPLTTAELRRNRRSSEDQVNRSRLSKRSRSLQSSRGQASARVEVNLCCNVVKKQGTYEETTLPEFISPKCSIEQMTFWTHSAQERPRPCVR
jgi:hypothetical protein